MDSLHLARRVLRSRWLPLAALLVMVCALAAAWRFTPLGDAVEPRALAQRLEAIGRSPWAPLLICGLFIAANLVLISNMALTTATILALGGVTGVFYALLGSLAAGLVGFWIGRGVGAKRLERLDLPGVKPLSRTLRSSGLLGVTVLRMLPVAPYGIVNIAMGAFEVRLHWFAIGTVLGLLPSTFAVGIVGDRVRSMLSDGFDAADVGVVIAIIVALAAVIALLRRWLSARAAAGSG